MRQFRRWVRRALGAAVLAMVSLPSVGFTEQLLMQGSEVVGTIKGQDGLPAGVAVRVTKGSIRSVERQAPPMGINQRLLAELKARPSPAWLDLHGGKSRAVNREPNLWRYEF